MSFPQPISAIGRGVVGDELCDESVQILVNALSCDGVQDFGLG
jgi:hypothetical protein